MKHLNNHLFKSSFEVDQRIQIAWITHNSFKNNGHNMWQEILTFGKFLLY